MSEADTADQKKEAAPEPKAAGAGPKPGPVIRTAVKFVPPSRISKPVFWFLIVMASFLLVILGLLMGKLAMPTIEEGPPALAQPFKDQKNQVTFCPPLNWNVNDPHDGWNIYIKGPPEHGFPPLIIMSLAIEPGSLRTYLAEHKARIEKEEKTLKWVSEEEDAIDGCRTMRLEYDCDLMESGKLVKVRTLQYVLDESPRFYRITCHVAAEKYQKYLARFEACARSFKRAPTPVVLPPGIMQTKK